MKLAAAANFAGPPVTFTQLFAPNGVAIVNDGSIFVHNDTGLANAVTRFTPERRLLADIGLGGVRDLGLTGRMALDPVEGLILHLSEMGLLQAINPNTGVVSLVLDLRNPQVIPIDATQAYDLPRGQVRNFSGEILQFDGIQPRINFGDIAILRRGNRVDIFMTGVSVITAFVMRLTLENNTARARVLVASSVQVGANVPFGRPLPTSSNPSGARAGFINVARGVAVNGNGTVLTSLPVPDKDVAITFNADYNPAAGPPPTVILGGQNLFSRGMTTDNQGNFYLATGSIGTTACGINGSGALVIIPQTLNGLSCGNLGTNVILADSLDVAVNAAGDRAYMTILNLGLLVEYPIDPATAVQVSAGGGSGGGGGGGSIDWFLAILTLVWGILERKNRRSNDAGNKTS